MSEKFELVKSYLSDMNIAITSEDAFEELVVVNDDLRGLSNLIIDCEAPILVVEQAIMPVPAETGDLFKRLLQMNRELVHGAFVLDAECKNVIFRDTLQLENLDRNELEATIQALTLALAEFGSELLDYVQS